MNCQFSNRMKKTQKSFIREILKVTQNNEYISFAGGLPNPCSFPKKEITKSAFDVLTQEAEEILQYTTTEGYYPLRKYIADRYLEKRGLKVDPDEIIITNGSQQGLDLIGKVFLDTSDKVILERPGYLGAIQAFGMFEPKFVSVKLEDDGIDIATFKDALNAYNSKIFYCVPNFQNPSGITYSLEKRKAVGEAINKISTILVEDDAYGELRFTGDDLPLIKSFADEKTILLGSFSKIVSPGLRLGWICAKKEIIDKLIVAKQASDLHSNYLSQRVIYEYLMKNDIEDHIIGIKEVYKRQCDLMVRMLEKTLGDAIIFTKPQGGMFLWVTIPDKILVMELFEKALEEKVVFVPGLPFYTDNGGNNTLRLNFSNSSEEKIKVGIRRFASTIKNF